MLTDGVHASVSVRRRTSKGEPRRGEGAEPTTLMRLMNDWFARVVRVASTLPDVEVATRYDGTPVLKARGCFMAAIATHPSAEPDSLVLRSEVADRELFIEEAPDTYYLTDYYARYPLVLVRLCRIEADALRELLSMSWRLTMAKARPRSARPRR
jgi:hypothetical protein